MIAVRRTTRWTVAELTARCWRIRAWAWSGELARARAELERLEASSGGRAEAAVPLAMARAWLAWLDGDLAQLGDQIAAVDQLDTSDHLPELALLSGVAHREGNRLALAIVRCRRRTPTPTTWSPPWPPASWPGATGPPAHDGRARAGHLDQVGVPRPAPGGRRPAAVHRGADPARQRRRDRGAHGRQGRPARRRRPAAGRPGRAAAGPEPGGRLCSNR
jgi:hypothetical protein